MTPNRKPDDPQAAAREPVDLWRHALLNAFAHALPALERRAAEPRLTRAQQRERLRTLLAWLAGQRGFQARRHAPMRYFEVPGQWIGGKLDLAVHARDDRPVVAIEVDWLRTRASVHKLVAARNAGYRAVWLVDFDEARKQADDWMGKPTNAWLAIYRLGSGVVR